MRILKKIVNFHKKHFLPILGMAVAAALVALGFGYRIAEITACSVVVEKFVTAEYSEISVDFEGNLYTDYWSEQASAVYVTETLNGDLVGKSHDFKVELRNNTFWPEMPLPDLSMSKEPYFDRFSRQSKSALHISASDGELKMSFVEPARKNTACISRLGQYSDVKTWYGHAYGSDFL